MSLCLAAQALLRQLRQRRRVGVRLLGISLSSFDDGPTEDAQLGLFAEPPQPDDGPREGPRDRALTRALDRIRDRFGSTAILPADLVGGTGTGPRVEE